MATSAAPAATTSSGVSSQGLLSSLATPGATASNPASMAANRESLVQSSGGKLQDVNGKVVPTSSPTVMSDSNIRENIIPATISKATPYITPQSPTTPVKDANGNPSNTDTSASSSSGSQDLKNTDYDSLYKSVFGDLQDETASPEASKEMQLLEGMKSTQDTAFSTQISTIQSQYDQRIQLQSAANSALNGKETNFLLKSGAFNTSTAAPALYATETEGINKIGSLQAQENNSIARIQTAQANEDYKTMSEELKNLDKIQTDKKSLAEKITQNMIKENDKLNTQIIQSKKDNAVADLITKGITDPKEILAQADPSLNLTEKDITASLNNIAKAQGLDTAGLTGNIKNFYTLKNSNSLPGNISKLPEDQQLKAFLDMEKTSTKATTTKPLYTTAKGVPISKADIAGGVTKLDESRDKTTGFADSKLYKAMADKWEEEGLSLSDFTKQYPPKYYIDPADTTLPEYLRPTTTKGKSSPANPFSKSSTTK